MINFCYVCVHFALRIYKLDENINSFRYNRVENIKELLDAAVIACYEA